MYADTTTAITFPRWMMAVPFAMGLTILLFNFMVKLIFTDFAEPIDEPAHPIPDPFFEHTVIETHSPIEKIKKPEPQERPSEPEPIVEKLDNPEISVPQLAVNTGEWKDAGIGLSGMPVAQYQVQPKYPRRAIQGAIEGYVDVRFDISKIGATENVQAIGAQPQGVFEKSAIAAVKRWRYQPQIKDGEPAAYTGMVNRITFQMQK